MTAPVKDPHRLVVRGDRDLFELKVNPEFPARGRGVFSKFSFARGDFITEYTGCVITKQWAKGLEKKGGTSHFITIDQHHVIVGWTSNDIEDGYGIGSLFNDPRHSADRPNVALEKIEINAGVGKRLPHGRSSWDAEPPPGVCSGQLPREALAMSSSLTTAINTGMFISRRLRLA